MLPEVYVCALRVAVRDLAEVPYSKDKRMRKQTILVAAVAGVLALAGLAQASPSPTDVSPGNMGNWTFYTCNGDGDLGVGTGIGEMVNGPATPPQGTGSAHLMPPADNGSQGVQLRNAGDWVGTKITALTALSFSTYVTSWNGQQSPWLVLYINTSGNSTGAYDERLIFEPCYSDAGAGNGNPNPQPDVTLNTWQTWNGLTGMWYSDHFGGDGGSNALTLSAILALEPNQGTNAVIVDATPGVVGGIRLSVGQGSVGNVFDANVDAFTIGTAAGTTIYNFEAPEPASLALMTGGLVLLLGRRRRRAGA